MYTVMAGVEVYYAEDFPIEISLKVVPAGKYAHFSHCMKDSGFGEAFENIEKGQRDTGTELKDLGLQVYGTDFDPEDEDSVLNIYMPLKQ